MITVCNIYHAPQDQSIFISNKRDLIDQPWEHKGTDLYSDFQTAKTEWDQIINQDNIKRKSCEWLKRVGGLHYIDFDYEDVTVYVTLQNREVIK